MKMKTETKTQTAAEREQQRGRKRQRKAGKARVRRRTEQVKLKLISRQANINFKFAKRLQDNQQHRAARSGASRQSFLLPFVAPHFSAQLELESPMESQKGSPWFLQLTSHRCLLAALPILLLLTVYPSWARV